MTPAEAADILRQFNAWRRDFDDKIRQPDSYEIGEAIDAAVEIIERLEEAESDALEQARLNGMGSEREASLMAKLESAEKERDALRAENEALATNLRGKHSITGATYAHLIAERDALRTELAGLRSSMTFRTSLIGRIEAERDYLQAKVEAMERQEPVAVVDYKRGSCVRFVEYLGWQKIKDGAKLYALPGAQTQGEEK